MLGSFSQPVAIAIAAGVLSGAGLLFWQNTSLRADNAELTFQLSVERGNLAAAQAALESAEAAASVLRIQRAQAEQRAAQADAQREAILRGDSNAIDSFDGSTGDALRLLSGANACVAHCLVGATGGPGASDSDTQAGSPDTELQ